jgi:hypothetical protein
VTCLPLHEEVNERLSRPNDVGGGSCIIQPFTDATNSKEKKEKKEKGKFLLQREVGK